MSGRYTIGSIRSNGFASQLESDWALILCSRWLDGIYVGDTVSDHDFELWSGTPDELWVEVKPDDNVAWYRNPFVHDAVCRLFSRFFSDYSLDQKLDKRDAVILSGRHRWLYLSWAYSGAKTISSFRGPLKSHQYELTEAGVVKVEEAKKKDTEDVVKCRLTNEAVARMDESIYVKYIVYDLLTPLRELRAGTHVFSNMEIRFEITPSSWRKI